MLLELLPMISRHRLVARMDELSTLFTGGDAGISAGVRAAWHDDPAAMSGDPGAPADEA
ncbi:hypothetical protein [Streptomyces sp. TLI_185]|uniref:hypothetical protein n=1 Tax=Streptomyces sp. TLI_185 TaxID=2485151 RepID=UPI0021A478E3|nr:hypothetical protein [Streptomyces sp. TLI_185]